ncbi:MAG: rhodanese-related sulfurtransferase [Halobacteriales archaeon]|jgi:rhodanese-related sulfurtransferase
MDGEISPDRVADLLEDDADLEIVDIREPEEFEAEHIPGSLNVPLSRLTGAVDRIEPADRIVTVCPRGEASVQAARLIAAYEGMDDAVVESMAGGLDAWDGPLETKGTADEGRARLGRDED